MGFGVMQNDFCLLSSAPLPLTLILHAESGSLLADEFSAEWLLLERYRVVEFEDLKAGLAHLDGEMSRRSVGTTSFIKGHVGSFIQCYDVLTDILYAYSAWYKFYVLAYCTYIRTYVGIYVHTYIHTYCT